MDKPMVGVGNNTSLTPVPPVDNEPADAGSYGMIAPSTAGSTPQGSPNQPAPLRCCTRTTWNQLPWRYWNFGLLADTVLTGIWNAWVGLCVCLHIVFCMYTISGEVQCKTHSICNIICLPSMTHISIQGNSLNKTSKVDSWAGMGMDQRTFGPIAAPLPE